MENINVTLGIDDESMEKLSSLLEETLKDSLTESIKNDIENDIDEVDFFNLLNNSDEKLKFILKNLNS